jgi:hypothetical protein
LVDIGEKYLKLKMYGLSGKVSITRKIKLDILCTIVKTLRLLFGTCFESMIDVMAKKTCFWL